MSGIIYPILLKIGRGMTVVFLLLWLAGALQSVVGQEAVTLCNTGGPWGWGNRNTFWIVLGCGAFFAFVVQWWQAVSFREEWFWVLLIVGGIGNLFSRIRFGCVTDSIQLVHWFPIFNVSDVLLFIGFFGFMGQWLFARMTVYQKRIETER